MITLDFEYRSWWCPWKRRCRSFAPSNWWEMDERQFMAVVRSILGRISEEEYYAELFGIPRRLVGHLDQWHIYVLRKQVRFLDNGKAETSRFFIRQVCGLLAPEDALGGVTLQQFMTADTFFSQFVGTVTDEKPMGSIKALARFVAALYMRRNEAYFVDRMPLRRTIIDLPVRQERVVDLEGNAAAIAEEGDPDVLWAVYLNWVMIRNWLARAYPLLFPEADSDEKGDATQKRVKNAWLNIFDTFVGDDVAHLDNYRRMACTDAFRLMNRRIKEAMKTKK